MMMGREGREAGRAGRGVGQILGKSEGPEGRSAFYNPFVGVISQGFAEAAGIFDFPVQAWHIPARTPAWLGSVLPSSFDEAI